MVLFCRVIVLLASGICPLVGEFNPGAYVIFLLRGTGVCPLVGGAGFYPPGGQGHVEGSTVHSH